MVWNSFRDVQTTDGAQAKSRHERLAENALLWILDLDGETERLVRHFAPGNPVPRAVEVRSQISNEDGRADIVILYETAGGRSRQLSLELKIWATLTDAQKKRRRNGLPYADYFVVPEARVLTLREELQQHYAGRPNSKRPKVISWSELCAAMSGGNRLNRRWWSLLDDFVEDLTWGLIEKDPQILKASDARKCAEKCISLANRAPVRGRPYRGFDWYSGIKTGGKDDFLTVDFRCEYPYWRWSDSEKKWHQRGRHEFEARQASFVARLWEPATAASAMVADAFKAWTGRTSEQHAFEVDAHHVRIGRRWSGQLDDDRTIAASICILFDSRQSPHVTARFAYEVDADAELVFTYPTQHTTRSPLVADPRELARGFRAACDGLVRAIEG